MNKLRIAYAGHDFFSSCLDGLARRPDVELVLCLVTPGDRPPTEVVRRISSHHGAQVVAGPWSDETIARVNEARVQLLVSAAYSYRIPVERLTVKWAVNVHPTLLPYGRGPDPLPYTASSHRDRFGITIHEMTKDFDQGPVLLQERIEPEARDGFDELHLKLFAAAPRLLDRFVDDIDVWFERKVEQVGGSYWPNPSEDARVLCAEADKAERALDLQSKFGFSGFTIVLRDGARFTVRDVVAARCEHSYEPGTIVVQQRTGCIVATPDGLVRVRR